MATGSSASSFQEHFKKMALMMYQEKSDEELDALMYQHYRKISQLPMTPDGHAEMERLTGEMEAIKEILALREKYRENLSAMIERWTKDLPARKRAAVLHLPNAVSPNGQLVAAILEDEDGKSADELAGWCDELAALDAESFQALLDGLVQEKILTRDDSGLYHLQNICDERMQVDTERILAARKGDYEARKLPSMRLLLQMMRDRQVPLCQEDLIALLPSYSGKIERDPRLRGADISKLSVESLLWSMERLGLITERFRYNVVKSETYYTITMLGEDAAGRKEA